MSAALITRLPIPWAATVLLKAATMRGCWFSRMVLTAPMLEIAGLPMPPAAVSGITTGLSLMRIRQASRCLAA